MNSKFVGLLLTAFAVVAVDWTAKPTFADDRLARNVILFIGDAGGIPTINAAAIYKYRAPRKLFIHTMPYVALVETVVSLRMGHRLCRGHDRDGDRAQDAQRRALAVR